MEKSTYVVKRRFENNFTICLFDFQNETKTKNIYRNKLTLFEYLLITFILEYYRTLAEDCLRMTWKKEINCFFFFSIRILG